MFDYKFVIKVSAFATQCEAISRPLNVTESQTVIKMRYRFFVKVCRIPPASKTRRFLRMFRNEANKTIETSETG